MYSIDRVDFVETLPLLEMLNLSQNELLYLPPDMGGLAKLKKLYAQQNKLKSLLMHCVHMEELFVQHNHIREIPPELAHMTNLSCLSLAHNELESVPQAFHALLKLTLVDLSGNHFKSFMDVPEHLRRLHERHAVLHSRFVLMIGKNTTIYILAL
jgi:Leucine-rich repeat (LRR) protein